jgi:hypothetical protein
MNCLPSEDVFIFTIRGCWSIILLKADQRMSKTQIVIVESLSSSSVEIPLQNAILHFNNVSHLSSVDDVNH